MSRELLELWASVYANHGALRTAVGFVHLGGLLLGGGCAVAGDLATIAAGRTPSVASQVELQGLERTHRLVAAGLTVVLVSGLLLFAADIDTYWHSRVYWLKMGLVVLLVANGALLVTAERQLRLGHPKGRDRLRNAARASLALWFVTTLAGAALPNIG